MARRMAPRRLRQSAAGLPLALIGAAALQAAAAPSAPQKTQVAPASQSVAPARPRAERLTQATAAVWSGRLAEAQRALLEVADREVGARDPALDFWSELSALLRCEPNTSSPRASRGLANEWDRLRRLVQIERARLDRRAAESASSDKVDRPLGAAAPPAGALTWPVEAERWDDEAPIVEMVLDHCAPPAEARRATAAPGSAAAPAEAAAAAQSSPLIATTTTAMTTTTTTTTTTAAGRSAEALMIGELTAALPTTHPALPALLLEQAALEIGAGEAAGALGPLGRLPPGAGDPGGPFSAGERAELALAWAVAADAGAAADPAGSEAAITRLRAALATDARHDVRRALAFRLSERLRAAGRADEAVAAIGPPPHGDDRLGRYLAFRQMEAHVGAGRRGEALAEAREALGQKRRAAVDADAALAAIDDLALRLLVGSPITAESIALIDALGTPSERLGRMERFAQMAGSVGVHASEMEAFLWLMQNDPDQGRQLHHLARASVAAALAGDRKQFARTFAELAGQEEIDGEPAGGPPSPAPANPTPMPAMATAPPKPARAPGLIDSPDAERLYKTRRRDRSLSWQRAMLIVARDALPALVENDDQVNLKILVDRLQRHLAAHGRGPVDAELTTVYRAASAHVRSGARAYAQRVGGGKRPILLGDIAVERRYEVPAPSVSLAPQGPRSLLWVPTSGTDPSAARLKRWDAPLGVSMTVAKEKR
jgi:hypothetical protein